MTLEHLLFALTALGVVAAIFGIWISHVDMIEISTHLREVLTILHAFPLQ